MDITDGFMYGIAGGALAELFGLFKLRHEAPSAFPLWIKSWFYWLVTIAMMLAGGVLVVIYLKSNIALQPIIAVNLGASAPLLIGTFATQAPRVTVN